MRIATRLTLLLVGVTFVVAVTVGWFAVHTSTQAQYATLDGTINAVVDSGVGHPNEALSNAINEVQANSYDLNLDLVSPSGSVQQINAATVPLTATPTLLDVRESLDRVRTVANLPGFRIRSLDAGGGDYLVVAGSTQHIANQSRQLALEVAIAGLVAALAVLALARIVMRRDLETMERLISYASEVAAGEDVGDVPAAFGSRDVRELRAALAVMVDALHERIAIETRSVEVMQQFIGDASHELRTPLTVIKGYNELLANPAATTEQQDRAVMRVQREIVRMESLISDLLLLAELREVPAGVGESFDASVALTLQVEEFASEHGERDVRSDIEPRVRLRGRRDHFDRLVINALTNIARHTDDTAAVRVTLRLERERCVLRIEDGGPGLPVYGQAPRRFHRFDESRSRESGGSGLGMSIMADIAGSMGGSMTTTPSDLGGLALNFDFTLTPAIDVDDVTSEVVR